MSKGLIDLQTDLKSLRYSSMPLGSANPYITKDINNPPSSNQTAMEITKRIDDTSRIAQMLIDKPGLKYLLHEAELQQIRVGDRIKKARAGRKTLTGALLQQVGATLGQTVKIIGSTLAQVPVNGTGTHFVRGFTQHTYLRGDGGTGVFGSFFGGGNVNGGQSAINGQPIVGKVDTQFIQGESVVDPNNTAKETQFTYSAKVLPTVGVIDNQEKINKPLTSADEKRSNVTTATEGKPITLEGQKVNSTKQPHTLGPSNKIDQYTDVLADHGGYTLSSSYAQGSEKSYTKRDTSSNIDAALKGTPVRVNPKVVLGETPNKYVPDELSYSNERIVVDQTVKGEADPTSNTISTGTLGSKLVPHQTKLSDLRIKVEQGSGSLAPKQDDRQVPTIQDFRQTNQDPTSTMVLNQASSTVGGVEIQDKSAVGTYKPNKDRGTLKIGTQAIQDFRKKGVFGSTISQTADTNPDGTLNVPYEEYNEKLIGYQTRIGAGNQGKKISRVNYAAPTDPDVIDKVNALGLTTTNPDGLGVDQGRDFAKLYFEVLTPGDSSVFIHFRAFLDSFDDSYTADWKGNRYVGRAEEFYTYGGFSRDFNFSFKIAAATRDEMKPLYKKMVYLASTTAPTYGGGESNFMRGTVVKLTLGSYLTQVPGVITSIKYGWNKDYPWEIAMKDPEGQEKGAQELPMLMDCSVTFKPIHDFAPQTGLYNYFTSKDPNKSFFTSGQAI